MAVARRAVLALGLALAAQESAAVVVAPHNALKSDARKQPAHRKPARLRGEPLASLPVNLYRQDCWKKVHMSLAQGASKASAQSKGKAKVPGAGIDQAALQPFQQVLKDGFYEVDCVKDYLFEHGDKFGNNKYAYELGSVSNVSIVLYNEIVPKEDRKPMSHATCFAFCRTVPDMLFFGIQNGRNCYCAPYFKPMAGDSSMCDVPCEGNPTQMCGGSAKSSVFEMHMCGTSQEELAAAAAKLGEVKEVLAGLQAKVAAAAVAVQAAATELQQKLGAAGDPTASALMQNAKVFAGELEHAASAAGKTVDELEKLRVAAADLAEGDATTFEAATQMEELTEQSERALAAAEAAAEELAELLAKTLPSAVEGTGSQYYPVLYFVDKSFVESPSTCGGEVVGKPVVGTFDACAAACDAEVHSCVGFGYFPNTQLPGEPEQNGGQGQGQFLLLQATKEAQTKKEAPQVEEHGLCFLYSKLTSVTYYTGCTAPGFLQKVSKVQAKDVTPATTKCVAKLSHFEGTTLAPDASGKCEQCLKSATKADRCFA